MKLKCIKTVLILILILLLCGCAGGRKSDVTETTESVGVSKDAYAHKSVWESKPFADSDSYYYMVLDEDSTGYINENNSIIPINWTYSEDQDKFSIRLDNTETVYSYYVEEKDGVIEMSSDDYSVTYVYLGEDESDMQSIISPAGSVEE